MINLSCEAILFDMDGTLVDSKVCVESIWKRWALRHGIDVHSLLQTSHRRRTKDTIRDAAPHLDMEAEAKALQTEELAARKGIVAVGGAFQLLSRLREDQWAVVTSASRELATVRLECAGLPVPSQLISTTVVIK